MKITKIALMITVTLIAAVPAFGQERKPIRVQEQNQYLVSVRAGMVNVAEGDVTYRRSDDNWEMLITGDSLRKGDIGRTGAGSRLEVLLNPGSYLRLDENAEFMFSNTAIDNLKVEILKGSALIEAASVDDWKGTIATVVTPGSTFGIVKGGLYRINVLSANQTEVLVYKGKIIYPYASRTIKDAEWLVIPNGDGKKVVAGVAIKEGKRALFEGQAPVIAAFDKKAQDELDVWSKERARILVAANKKISNRALRRVPTFASAWFYNPLLGCYTFLPGYYGFSSPYGGSYSVCNFNNNYYPHRPRNPNLGGGGYGGGSGSGSGSGYGGGNSGGGSGGSGGAVSRPGGGGVGRGGDGGAMPGNPRTGPSGVGGRNRDH
jgi:hypothetical protein